MSEGSVTEHHPVRAWLSLGSNISPLKHIPQAVDELREMFDEISVSPVYESEAVGFTGDNFFNLVVGIDTDLAPVALTAVLKKIEALHGRQRSGDGFDSRTLDIDLLTYGDQVIDSGSIQLPRDEVLRYAFVLLPLSEVAGDELHPVEGRTYRQLWQAFNGPEQLLWRVDGGLLGQI
ncbi:MAG: 2-amino-4-hydroxy-6-hydroxymethyldihydropteridine diphosphokinase [Candidatus Thiodiazotropha sp.]